MVGFQILLESSHLLMANYVLSSRLVSHHNIYKFNVASHMQAGFWKNKHLRKYWAYERQLILGTEARELYDWLSGYFMF